MFRIGVWLVAAGALAGCPSDPPPSCATVETACAPLYQPTFANVYANTIQRGCGSERAACHSAAGEANLSFADVDTAYAALRDHGHVIAGDASCSELVVRIVGVGEDYQMPPGDPLSAAEACAVVQWVQAGAQR